MKKRFTFNKLINNDKLMMVVSLLAAIAIWVMVLTGPMNIVDRVISTRITVNLGNSYAGLSGLRVIGATETEVQITVEGAWSVISRINAQDLRVSADLTAITGPGDFDLPLLVSRNSAETSYDILNVSPSTVAVHCDYWQEGTIFKVECDASTLAVTEPETMQIGEPVIDQSMLSNGMVTIDGPKETVIRIKRMVATLTSSEPLAATRRFEVPLTALDVEGKPVDLTHCSIAELPAGLIRVTVPLWEARQIALGVAAVNVPEGMDAQTLLTVKPQTIRVLGPTAELDALEEQLKAIATVDVQTLSLDSPSIAVPLTLPSTVRGEDVPQNVSVSLNTEALSQKRLSVTANETNTVLTGTNGKRFAVQSHTFDELLFVGDPEAIDALSVEDIVFNVSLDGAEEGWYTPLISVENSEDVWLVVSEETASEKLFVEKK